jgi:hypothetical protein
LDVYGHIIAVGGGKSSHLFDGHAVIASAGEAIQ